MIGGGLAYVVTAEGNVEFIKGEKGEGEDEEEDEEDEDDEELFVNIVRVHDGGKVERIK